MQYRIVEQYKSYGQYNSLTWVHTSNRQYIAFSPPFKKFILSSKHWQSYGSANLGDAPPPPPPKPGPKYFSVIPGVPEGLNNATT